MNEVRKIKKEELPLLLELYQHLHPNDVKADEQEIFFNWKKIMDSEFFHYFVIEIDGTFVASCNLTIVPNLTRGSRPFGVIENVVTHSRYRRKGLGKQVLLHTIEFANNMNCYKVMLLSNKERKEAHHFYSMFGFMSDSKTAFEIKF